MQHCLRSFICSYLGQYTTKVFIIAFCNAEENVAVRLQNMAVVLF